MNEGYFKLHRRFFSHDLWAEERSFSKAEAWLDLLQLAAFAPTKRFVRDKLLKIAEGELVASLRYLGKRWGWSKNKVGLFLDILDREGMTGREMRQGESVIILCNYREFNADTVARRDNKRDSDGTVTGQRRDKEEELEEGKEEYPLTPKGGMVGQNELFPMDDDSKRILPRDWKKMKETDRKRSKVIRNSPSMIQIGSWFGRRPDTLWTVAEGVALLATKPSQAEVDGMGRYYRADIDQAQDYRRRDLLTLLNNWAGELDRARIWVGKEEAR